MFPPLRGGGWCACPFVPPRGAPIPQKAQAKPEGLRCIRRCVGMDVQCAYLVPPRGIPIPKGAGRGGRDTGVSIAAGEGRVTTWLPWDRLHERLQGKAVCSGAVPSFGGPRSPLYQRPSPGPEIPPGTPYRGAPGWVIRSKDRINASPPQAVNGGTPNS